jgi:hypothetical protein
MTISPASTKNASQRARPTSRPKPFMRGARLVRARSEWNAVLTDSEDLRDRSALAGRVRPRRHLAYKPIFYPDFGSILHGAHLRRAEQSLSVVLKFRNNRSSHGLPLRPDKMEAIGRHALAFTMGSGCRWSAI